MIKVVHATAGKGVPVSMASGAVRAVLRSNVSHCCHLIHTMILSLHLSTIFNLNYS